MNNPSKNPGSESRLAAIPIITIAVLVIAAGVWVLLAHRNHRNSQWYRSIPPSYNQGQLAPSTSSPIIYGPTVYAGDNFGSRFYRASQITRANVSGLKMAWHTGVDAGSSYTIAGQVASALGFECSPIICRDKLIVVTPTEALVALDPQTGKRIWRFQPPGWKGVIQVNRGPSCWIGPKSDPHPDRILYTCMRTLYEVDADTGLAIKDFGKGGAVDISQGIDRGHPEMIRGNSPPMVARDLAIVPFMIDDDVRSDSPRGDIRAYDVRTGRIRWTFHTIPVSKSDPAMATWLNGSAAKTGAANAWSMFSYDQQRDLLYCPIGSASNDRFGGTRPGNDLYSDSIVCLHAQTGELVWHFQAVHHDLWDYDLPAEPLLFDFVKNGSTVPAVAVLTKMGSVFLFNRVTGAPLFPIREVPVPKSDVPGEWVSPTQPIQDLPKPLVQQSISASDAWGSSTHKEHMLYGMSKYHTGQLFTPPSLEGTIQLPGNYGGCNWAGASYDMNHGLIIATANNDPFGIQIVPRTIPNVTGASPMLGTPYWSNAREYSPDGMPGVKPPWSIMCAINPATGQTVWKRPYGYFPSLSYIPNYKSLGAKVVGGECVTSTGLIFGAGTTDAHLWVIDAATGEDILNLPLTTPAGSLPMIYTVNGKEYVVLCEGGHGYLGGSYNDLVVAFALGS